MSYPANSCKSDRATTRSVCTPHVLRVCARPWPTPRGHWRSVSRCTCRSCSNPLPCGLVQIHIQSNAGPAQHAPGHVRAKVFAAHQAVSGGFDGGAALHWNSPITMRPVGHVGRERIDRLCELGFRPVPLHFKVSCEVHCVSISAALNVMQAIRSFFLLSTPLLIEA